MKDWLGNELAVGDNIIYAAMSGRCVTMVIAEIVKFQDTGAVTVQPIRSSRWKQHWGTTRHIDTRTGKGINPDLVKKDGSKPHIETEAHYEDKDGNWFKPKEVAAGYVNYSYGRPSNYTSSNYTRWTTVYDDGGPYHGPRENFAASDKKWLYVPTKYKDYVVVENKQKSVTLTVTENITKWTGKLPDFENKEDK